MATVTHTTTLPDSSQKTDFYSLTDNCTVTGIVNADIASTAAIDGSKLASITTAGKVDGSSMTNLANIPSGAGLIPYANLTNAIPSGVILMWSGTIATIPSGWYLCNGSNGTPDLRNRFVVCANADSGGVAKSTVSGSATQSGGAATYDLSHTHNVPASTDTGWGGPGTASLSGKLAIANGGGGEAAGNATNDRPTGSGGSASQSVLNPYYALAYIMKS